MADKFIKYRNKNLFYRSIGSGKAVVLLHGFGEDGNIWNSIIEVLKDDFNLIVPDIPGSGKSEMLEGKDILLDDYAEAVKNILNNERISSCAFIGHSMGGYIALAFAHNYPELINALGLFHSTAFADEEEKKQTRLKAIEFIKKNGAHAFLKTAIPNLFSEKSQTHFYKEIDLLIENGKSFSDEALIEYYTAMINRNDTTEILKTLNKPVLFISGELDKAVPLQATLQQCHLPTISHIHILEDVGHMSMIENKKESTDDLQFFLRNI